MSRSTMPDSLGTVLVLALRRKDMTQAECARRTGLSSKHINNLVRGRARLTENSARKVGRVLGVDALDLLKVDLTYRNALAKRAKANGREDVA